ncbi:hypothetical protein E2R68_12530 [Psychromonas sp. RZ22]|uniref:DUF6942 family protein n=1 Tax=Psychromonas algarum TaxID=2555643 RepID=UPI0010674587|nr:hypothetical protein [Psychromonas sp. RZ22]TEW53403.1 hypothetical protein E2R68_12530 [Psychromonas sp. RZ22]
MSLNNEPLIGFGDVQFSLAVYIGNQPDMPEYQFLDKLVPLQANDISEIGKSCGNGWRKVFNVYAKLLYALDKKLFKFSNQVPTWQLYRDQYLLKANSGTALIFNMPQLTPCLNDSSYNNCNARERLHIICGRTYAKKMLANGELSLQLIWLNEEFAIDRKQRVIVSPYFDYRQLSNQKIEYLSLMLNDLMRSINS